ncbi:MAG: hybrid sensor histidine kinase/response regulator [Alphaproteobacteria bacterium]|nr:hybrid sensor histidine kinase/response regulator [Alphaproteobacteria bacterium]
MEHEPGCKQTILVVDDAPENIDVIKSILVPDYTVKVATRGVLALKIAQSQPPDLVLLDVMMPDLDGYEVCRQLKTSEVTRDVPVIFVTVRDQTEDETRGLDLGAVDYISKPIRPPILRARIRTHIALAEARRRLALQNRALIDAARLREDVEHIMRHDLKSPLNIIIGAPQFLLMQSNFTNEQREYLNDILEAGQRMLSMINNSLDIFKIENGAYDFRPKRIDLLAVMQGVLAELRMAIANKHLQVTILVDDREPGETRRVEVMAEDLLCHSMLSNLCKNAVEASPQGDRITIRFECGPQVVLSIYNGGEVPENIRDRFFDKFVTAGKRDGTGLGTYSAMLIARTHHGSITLDTSTPGRTCLRVTLPAAQDYAPRRPPVPQTPKG